MPDGGTLLEVENEYRKRYRLSKWWIEHRDRLRRIGMIIFACVDGVLVLFAAWNLLDAFVVSEPEETRAVLELAAYGQSDLHAYAEATAAKPLKAGTASALASSEGTYDLYAVLTNPNADWWAEFSYAFSSSGGETDSTEGFILPGSEKPVVAYAVDASAAPRSVSLKISNVTWHRVDHHLTGDFDQWIADRLGFEITNPTLEQVDLDGSSVGRVSFVVKNASAYGYYEPVFVIRLLRGSSVVGVTSTTLSRVNAGETRDVAVNWVGTVPNANKVDVSVDVNPFDSSTYKPLEGELPADTRARVLQNGR